MNEFIALTVGINADGAQDAAKQIENVGKALDNTSKSATRNISVFATLNQKEEEILANKKRFEELEAKLNAERERANKLEKEKARLVNDNNKLEKEKAAATERANQLEKEKIENQKKSTEIEKKHKEAIAKTNESLAEREKALRGANNAKRVGIVAGVLTSASDLMQADKDRESANNEISATATAAGKDPEREQRRLDNLAQSASQSLGELNNAINILNAKGIKPTNETLIQYSKLAKGLGISFSDAAHRIADATKGDFSGLELAGISVTKLSDKLIVSHGNYEESIDNTSAALQSALQGIAESEYKTAIDDEAKTFGGSMEQFGNNNAGLLAGIGSAINWAAESKLGAPVADGLQSVSSGTVNLLKDVSNFAEEIGTRVKGTYDIYTIDDPNERATAKKQYEEDKFERINNRRLASGEEYDPFRGRPDIDEAYERIINSEKQKNQKKTDTGLPVDVEALREGLKQFTDTTPPWLEDFEKASDNAPQSVFGTPLPSPESTNLSDDTSTDKAIEDAQKTSDIINETHKQTTEAHKLELDTQDANQKQSNAFRLEQYTQQGNALATYQNANLTTLRDTLKLEEGQVSESYQRRLQMVDDNVNASQETKDKLKQKVIDEFKEHLTGLEEQFMQEQEFIKASGEEKTQLLLDLKTDRDARIAELETKNKDDITKVDEANAKVRRQSVESINNNILSVTRDFAGEQSKIYQATFVATKAVAIAESIVAINAARAKAADDLPFPQNLVVMATIAAETASIVSNIKATTLSLSGAYDHGGMIPSGSQGIVGEFGPELVSGPAIVTSRRTTADREHSQNQTPTAPAEPPVVNIRQINAFDTGVINDFIGSDEGEQVILNIIRRNPETLRSLAAA